MGKDLELLTSFLGKLWIVDTRVRNSSPLTKEVTTIALANFALMGFLQLPGQGSIFGRTLRGCAKMFISSLFLYSYYFSPVDTNSVANKADETYLLVGLVLGWIVRCG